MCLTDIDFIYDMIVNLTKLCRFQTTNQKSSWICQTTLPNNHKGVMLVMRRRNESYDSKFYRHLFVNAQFTHHPFLHQQGDQQTGWPLQTGWSVQKIDLEEPSNSTRCLLQFSEGMQRRQHIQQPWQP